MFICNLQSLQPVHLQPANLWPAARNQSGCLPTARNLWPTARNLYTRSFSHSLQIQLVFPKNNSRMVPTQLIEGQHSLSYNNCTDTKNICASGSVRH